MNLFTQGQTLLREHADFISRTARSLAYSYPTSCAEDIEQEVAIFLWEKEEYFIKHESTNAYVRASIKNVALNHAQRMRDQTFLSTDCFFYTIDEVKELLSQFLHGEIGQMPETWETWSKGDDLEVYADLSSTWDTLTEAQKAVLQSKFLDDAELDSTQRQALSRAIRKFTNTLNNKKNQEAREYSGPGSNRKPSRTASIEAVAV